MRKYIRPLLKTCMYEIKNNNKQHFAFLIPYTINVPCTQKKSFSAIQAGEKLLYLSVMFCCMLLIMAMIQTIQLTDYTVLGKGSDDFSLLFYVVFSFFYHIGVIGKAQ